MNEKTAGIATKSTYHCNTKCHPSISLAEPHNPKSYTSHNAHVSVLDYDANIYAMLSPYMNGTGQRDQALRMSIMDLPNSSNFDRNISRHQTLIGKQIEAVTKHEMELAMATEIKETILHEESQEFYDIEIKNSRYAGQNRTYRFV